MLKLCGFHVSNYHNKVRIALLEKGIPFEEDASCRPSQDEAFLARSPLGKVPWIELGDGRRLSESATILEYLEEAHPEKPLLPRDPFERAKVRELVTYLEWHLEITARRLYPYAFFGKGAAPDATKASVEKELGKGLRALRGMVKFSPYIAGAGLTLADCAAFVHLPLVSLTTKIVYGRDFLEDGLPQAKAYLRMLGERPAFAKVNEDRKAAQSASIAKAREQAAGT
ncbi:MAG TPA: glutathione S-transferase family protein [Burkholderiales bacterium]|nr:glutathione S-transferase family protein [Burkholderiales bacterium]